MRVVLLADNAQTFLQTRAEFLRQEGYEVITASTYPDAERVLSEGLVHLAILDMRLIDDADERDESGLTLAKKKEYRVIPKILLTSFLNFEIVREAMGSDDAELPPVVELVAKQEGLEVLLKALERAFSRFVRHNPTLVIHFCEGDLASFSTLATLLEPALSGESLSHRAGELKYLFCQLFEDKTEVKIDRLLWTDEGRAALLVLTFGTGKTQPQVVVCGRSQLIVREASRRHEFAPDAPGENATTLIRTCKTMHFAANAYALAGMTMEGNATLNELYREHQWQTFNAVLETLFERTLAAWQQETTVAARAAGSDAFYREALRLDERHAPVEEVRRRIDAVTQQLPRLGAKIEEEAGRLTLRLGRQSFSYPHPATRLHSTSANDSPLLANTPGRFSGQNILADLTGRAWLTDFADAGRRPLLWNYTALEAIIRFDWAHTNSIQELHELERSLTDSFTALKLGEVEMPLRKPLRAIRRLRQLANSNGQADWRDYQLGLFYHAAQRLVAFDPVNRLTNRELARLTHVILAQAMICEKLALEPAPVNGNLRLDHASHMVWVGGRRVRLTGLSYKLLSYLEGRRDEPCSRREVIEHALGEEFDETDTARHQQARLNTSIRRLREAIEENPDDPRYLLMVPGVGYMLVSGNGANPFEG